MGEVKAFIFDMDGVIVNSMPMHLKIWKNMFEKRNVSFSLKIFEKYNGTSTYEIGKKLIEDHGLDEKPEDIVKEKFDTEKGILDEELELFSGVKETLGVLRKKGYKLALATSALKHMYEYVVNRFGLSDYFDAACFSGEVEHSKPAPDLFLLAAKKLGVNPISCCVVEDAVNGVVAAKAAGMKAIGITTTFDEGVFGEADKIISDINELKNLSC